jgi:DNA-binding MarR family transcriptional regulator/GNAT superfamily N-acetyltransferase
MSFARAQLDQIRSFNRVLTRRIGVLDDHYLGRNRPVGQDRMLWEIGVEGCEVRALRARLGLDAGHTSRLLRALEASRLITVKPSATDRRVRIARLTKTGHKERALLADRSDELAASMLSSLEDAQRDELIDAMRTVRRLLTSTEIEIKPVDAANKDAQRCVQAYVAELNRRADIPFDPAKGASVEPHEMTPPAGLFLVAYRHGEAVGCGGVRHRPGGPSEIKRLWVAEPARGLGIGRRIHAELEAEARRSGATTVRLETNGTLVESIAMYRSSGYREVEPFNDEPFATHWFAKRL